MISGITNPLYSIWGSSGSNVFAVGTGTILHYNGNQWSTVFTDSSNTIYGIWGRAEDDVYAVGGHGGGFGRVYHYDGNSWTIMDDLSVTLTCVWGNTNSVFVGGYFGSILKYTEEQVLPIEANIDIQPDTMNLNSKGESKINTYIELPSGYDVNLINLATIKLSYDGTDILPLSKPTNIGDYDSDGIADLMVKFNRNELVAILSTTGDVELTVSGGIGDNSFEGSDTVKVLNKGK